ncbi:actin-related protein 5 [Phlebotomus argentipes]|uniref:actin-related protein 5 n=1 Tax=Phlebotomus argentipes TaxID=94469 RepID=UPI00289359F8|nr:actin-related protein 5 [Phlebotomus argentipes]
MNIFALKDIKTVPDIVHEYSPDYKGTNIPLVIDNGSYQCRAGWASDDQPTLVFRNLIAKPRKDRNKKDGEVPVAPVVQIGNDIVNIEALRFQLRTQFDRNVVTHYHIQEQIFDYIFKHLGIDTEGRVEHPIVMTECFVNPNSCRQMMSELLFECYDVPSVCYGVDSLFSLRQNQPNVDYALVISLGYHTTHITPVAKGLVLPDKTRRINLGGFNMLAFLHRLLQLKYPVHVNAITLRRAEEILHEHCLIACDYSETLRNWASMEFYEPNVRKIQLPFNQTGISAWLLTAEQRMEKKRDLARRLTELNARRREEQQAEDEELLTRLLEIKELYRLDREEFDYALLEFQVKGIRELHNMIRTLTSKVERTKQRMAAQQEAHAQATAAEDKVPHPPVGLTVEEWVKQVNQQRQTLLDKRQARRQRRQDLAKRHTAAAQERMRIISLLARKEKGTDDFGMRDEDWDIYKTISREGGDSDSEVENEKLVEYEEILRHHDPTFTIEEPQNSHSGTAEYHQLHLGVEIHRAPEILFQPSMIGSTEAGLAETIDFVLKLFPAEEQLLLANNVYVTGSCAKFPGLEERLSRELLEMRPFQTPHKITMASNPTLDAWLGASSFARQDTFMKMSVSKREYEEFGGEYLKEHVASNKYYPTPAAPVIEMND